MNWPLVFTVVMGAFLLLAGVCAGLTSCAEEQGDRQNARRFAVSMAWFLVLAVIFGLAAWRVR